MFIEEKIWRVPDKLNLEHLFASKTEQNISPPLGDSYYVL